MLRIEGLHVSYGRIPAVKGISLRVDAGELVGLVGPNGAGKTTTVTAAVGLVRPAAGEISFRGRPITGRRPEDLARSGIALVPEGRHIFGTLTVLENLRLGTTPARDRAAAARAVDDMMERFPVLGRYRETAAAKLSGGEQQMLAIGRALVGAPELLLLDEPTLGLAPLIVDQIFDVLVELREQGTTTLLVEQNATRTIELADRTYILRAGEIAMAGTRDELVGRAELEEAFLGFSRTGP